MSALLMLAALAAADDGAMVRCVTAKTPVPELEMVQAATVATVTTGKPPSARVEGFLTKIRARAAECQPGSGAVDSRAGDIAVSWIAVETLSSALQKAGVDVPAINTRLSRTPPATLDTLLARKRSADVGALMTELQSAAGANGSTPAVSRLLAGYAFNAVRLAKLFKSTAS